MSKILKFGISRLRTVQNLPTSQSRARKSVEICYNNFHVSTDIFIPIAIFCSGKVIESLSRFLNLDRRDKDFNTVEIFSTVKTYFLKLSRSRVSIQIKSRQIEIPRLTFKTSFPTNCKIRVGLL